MLPTRSRRRADSAQLPFRPPAPGRHARGAQSGWPAAGEPMPVDPSGPNPPGPKGANPATVDPRSGKPLAGFSGPEAYRQPQLIQPHGGHQAGFNGRPRVSGETGTRPLAIAAAGTVQLGARRPLPGGLRPSPPPGRASRVALAAEPKSPAGAPGATELADRQPQQ